MKSQQARLRKACDKAWLLPPHRQVCLRLRPVRVLHEAVQHRAPPGAPLILACFGIGNVYQVAMMVDILHSRTAGNIAFDG